MVWFLSLDANSSMLTFILENLDFSAMDTMFLSDSLFGIQVTTLSFITVPQQTYFSTAHCNLLAAKVVHCREELWMEKLLVYYYSIGLFKSLHRAPQLSGMKLENICFPEKRKVLACFWYNVHAITTGSYVSYGITLEPCDLCTWIKCRKCKKGWSCTSQHPLCYCFHRHNL